MPKIFGTIEKSSSTNGQPWAKVKCGDSTTPLSVATAINFNQAYVKCTAATGTARGIYERLYLTAGAGGEAGRFFTTNSAAAPTDTINGVHVSLSHGATTGNVTGLATAGRFTYHVPNRSLTGNNAAVMAELYADGSSSANGGILSFHRFSLGGNATGITALTQHAGVVAWHFDAGCVDATNGVVDSNRTSNTAGGCIKVYIDGVGLRWITYGTGA